MEKCNANLISHTNDAQTPDAYDEIAHVRVPPGYADHPEDERILLFPHSHSRTTRPLEIYSAEPILHDPNFQNVTITWYRLSRLTVYPSHTLLTFLTPLNQEPWTIVLWIVDIFDIIKSRAMVYRSMDCTKVNIFDIIKSRTMV